MGTSQDAKIKKVLNLLHMLFPEAHETITRLLNDEEEQAPATDSGSSPEEPGSPAAVMEVGSEYETDESDSHSTAASDSNAEPKRGKQKAKSPTAPLPTKRPATRLPTVRTTHLDPPASPSPPASPAAPAGARQAHPATPATATPAGSNQPPRTKAPPPLEGDLQSPHCVPPLRTLSRAHATADCSRKEPDPNVPPSCVLCQTQGHPANYRGYPKAPRRPSKGKSSRQNAAPRLSPNKPQDTVPAPPVSVPPAPKANAAPVKAHYSAPQAKPKAFEPPTAPQANTPLGAWSRPLQSLHRPAVVGTNDSMKSHLLGMKAYLDSVRFQLDSMAGYIQNSLNNLP
ncbi:unnamed protein product [Euphydryas editha]|uniref:Uncharacterized protein n=1 Tax=Euphydryas editha TaxID=104508 RepID=A0AAU9USA3_EUPED|nr:unnamed protein product [Euphydryas editha]